MPTSYAHKVYEGNPRLLPPYAPDHLFFMVALGVVVLTTVRSNFLILVRGPVMLVGLAIHIAALNVPAISRKVAITLPDTAHAKLARTQVRPPSQTPIPPSTLTYNGAVQTLWWSIIVSIGLLSFVSINPVRPSTSVLVAPYLEAVHQPGTTSSVRKSLFEKNPCAHD